MIAWNVKWPNFTSRGLLKLKVDFWVQNLKRAKDECGAVRLMQTAPERRSLVKHARAAIGNGASGFGGGQTSQVQHRVSLVLRLRV